MSVSVCLLAPWPTNGPILGSLGTTGTIHSPGFHVSECDSEYRQIFKAPICIVFWMSALSLIFNHC